MESLTKEFALFIDGIRIEKGISRVDLIEDIISLSQYKRYLRGATAIPNNIVMELANRLQYNITELYSQYTKKYLREDTQLKDVSDLIKHSRFEEAHEHLKDINKDLIVSNYYRTLYEYFALLIQHKLGRVSDIHILTLYSQIIDFPNCMNKGNFTLVEVSVLDQMIQVSSSMGNFEAANMLYSLITEGKFIYSNTENRSILPRIYYTLSTVFFKQEELNKTIEIANIGIQESISDENFSVLPHLYYLLARSYTISGDLTEGLDSMRKCFMQLIVIGNKDLYNSFQKLYQQQYEEPLSELLSDLELLIK